MTESSTSKPAHPDPVEREFAETLRLAAYIFEKEKNGRFLGSITACRAVARFIAASSRAMSRNDLRWPFGERR
jgi:hypothetical protein